MGDLRYAFRQLARTPGFTAVVILTLSLCIGANSAIFSVVHAIVLKPYPWPGSERLIYANNTYPMMGLADAGVSIPDYLDRRSLVSGFADSAAYTRASLNLSGDAQPEMINGLSVTPSLFTTLEAGAALGRVFNEEDAKADAAPTVILSHALWKGKFGSDPAVIGRVIRINDRPVTVVGVMAEDFYFPSPKIQAWTPFSFTPAQREDKERGNEFSSMIARLKPGATIVGVQRELDQIQARNAERLPQVREFWRTSGFGGHAVGFLERNVRDVRKMLWLIQAGVAAALLIGCANVAGLLLARSVGREKELAIRTALGASRTRVIRLLLTESLILFLAGGSAGVVVAKWGIDALQRLGLSSLPRSDGIGLDPGVFVFTFACALATGLVFGAIPAWTTSRGNPSASLKEAGVRGSAGRKTQRLRAALVVAEIALSVMLVATAGLLVESFVRLEKVNPGFLPEGVLSAQVALPAGKYPTPEATLAFHDAVVAHLEGVAGVRAVGATDCLPFSEADNSASYSSPDILLAPGAALPHARVRSADPGFLGALGLTLLRGRWFNESDKAGSLHVAVIDRLLLDRYWRGQDPIGKRIIRNGSPDDVYTVIGVVATVKAHSLDESSDKETLYFPFSQVPQRQLMFVVRTSGSASALSASIRDAVTSVDPTQPVFDSVTMTERMDNAAQPRRAPVVLLSVFGMLAMALAMLGVYGILAFSVVQRTSEFGVRMALGASPAHIAGLVFRLGAVLAGIGIAVGLAGYLAISRVVATLLYGTPATDPLMLAAAPLALVAVAFAACLLPVVRATRVQPSVALRQD